MSKVLFLVGMPGTGKTEWGRRIARAYSLPAVELDAFIENREGGTITDIFRNNGEETFRLIESHALRQILRDTPPPFVLSSGGGTLIDQSNLFLMQQRGIVVYLKAEISTHVHNLKSGLEQRPLLSNTADPEARLTSIYNSRKDVYEQAHHIFAVETLSLTDFEPIIRKCIEPH